MVSGTDWLRRSFPSRVAKTARICSKRRATSRPFLSPASVMTVKWAEWTSSQGEGSAAAAGLEHRNSPHSVRQSAMARVWGIVPRRGNAPKGNATTMVWVSVVLWFVGPPFRRLSRSVAPQPRGQDAGATQGLIIPENVYRLGRPDLYSLLQRGAALGSSCRFCFRIFLERRAE